MTEYIIRNNKIFTIEKNGNIFTSGQTVDLNKEEFELHKHKLEGVENTILPLDLPIDQCFPEPYLTSIIPNKLSLGNDGLIEIKGSFFTPNTTISILGCSVNNYEFINSNLVKVQVTAGNKTGKFDLVVDNGQKTILRDYFEIVSSPRIIVDLRLGGTEFSSSAIEMASAMSYTREADGLIFTGLDIWKSWARFVGDDDQWVWNRSKKKTLSWISTNSTDFMLGIGSRANSPNSNAQYYEAEIVSYILSNTLVSSIFGNDGTPGNSAFQSFSALKHKDYVYKIVFTSNGENGGTLAVYQLPSANIDDWTDLSYKISQVTISAIGSDEPEIMPFALPRNGSNSKFLGFILEDE